ncbi:MAG: FUN14 domain-containing protein [Candidatus Bathyarchaeia archaeon]|nr:hypothetical protein [Candidatus Bathyarchaeota archaeon]
MSEVLTPIVYQLGIGGFLGFFVGYAVKKITKIVAVLIGVGALILIYLGYEGVISINYDKLAQIIENIMGKAGSASAALTPMVANLPFAGSFIAGVAVGVKLG